MNTQRKRVAGILFMLFVMASLVTGVFRDHVFADQFYESSPYHTYSGGWTQTIWSGLGKGNHWTRYSVVRTAQTKDVYATIKSLNYVTETKNGEYEAKITSKYNIGPYETHKHGGGQY